jgi:hypothetical protein
LAVLPAFVKLVLTKLIQVPVPPCTVPSETMFDPSQNCVGALAVLTTRLTWPETPVFTVMSDAVKPVGNVPKARVRSVSVPV